MPSWLNHAVVAAPRNGTTSHTVASDGTGGTVVGGSAFTPTAGSLLVVIVEGGVTSTTPSGWTLPTSGSAINNTGLYVWTRTAASGSNSLTTTHNGSNYPVVFHFLEFPSGSTFVKAASSTGVANGGAGPSLTSLTGTNSVFGVVGQINNAIWGGVAASFTWSTGTEAADYSEIRSGTTDGYNYSTTYVDGYTGATWSAAATSTQTGGPAERIVFAVSVPPTGTPGNATSSSATTGAPSAPSGLATAAAAVAGVVALVGAPYAPAGVATGGATIPASVTSQPATTGRPYAPTGTVSAGASSTSLPAVTGAPVAPVGVSVADTTVNAGGPATTGRPVAPVGAATAAAAATSRPATTGRPYAPAGVASAGTSVPGNATSSPGATGAPSATAGQVSAAAAVTALPATVGRAYAPAGSASAGTTIPADATSTPATTGRPAAPTGTATAAAAVTSRPAVVGAAYAPAGTAFGASSIPAAATAPPATTGRPTAPAGTATGAASSSSPAAATGAPYAPAGTAVGQSVIPADTTSTPAVTGTPYAPAGTAVGVGQNDGHAVYGPTLQLTLDAGLLDLDAGGELVLTIPSTSMEVPAMGLHVGDTAPRFTATLRGGDGQPVNLTGVKALSVHLKRPGGVSTATLTATVAGAPEDGKILGGAWGATLDVHGTWRAEVQVTYSDDTIQTFGPALFQVEREIA